MGGRKSEEDEDRVNAMRVNGVAGSWLMLWEAFDTRFSTSLVRVVFYMLHCNTLSLHLV